MPGLALRSLLRRGGCAAAPRAWPHGEAASISSASARAGGVSGAAPARMRRAADVASASKALSAADAGGGSTASSDGASSPCVHVPRVSSGGVRPRSCAETRRCRSNASERCRADAPRRRRRRRAPRGAPRPAAAPAAFARRSARGPQRGGSAAFLRVALQLAGRVSPSHRRLQASTFMFYTAPLMPRAPLAYGRRRSAPTWRSALSPRSPTPGRCFPLCPACCRPSAGPRPRCA